MNPNQLVEFIRRYNRWRRGDESLTMENPAMIGNALDAASDTIENQERMIQLLKVQLTVALDEIARIRIDELK